MTKKILILCFVLCVITSFSACSPNYGKTDNVNIIIDESTVFTKDEIQNAANTIIKKFKDFKGCELIDLWYNQEEQERKAYTAKDKNGEKVSEDNIIILFSSFYAGPAAAEEGFNPDTTYKRWYWVLTRDSKTSKWRVYSRGIDI